MWLMTRYGFYSIVTKKPGVWQVRGRVKNDLLRLRSVAKVGPDVTEVGGGDYPYRLIIEQEDYIKVMSALMESVTYANFKSEIGATAHQKDKLHAYHDIWGIMAKFGCKLFGGVGKAIKAQGEQSQSLKMSNDKCKGCGCTLFVWERDDTHYPGWCEPCVEAGKAKKAVANA